MTADLTKFFIIACVLCLILQMDGPQPPDKVGGLILNPCIMVRVNEWMTDPTAITFSGENSSALRLVSQVLQNTRLLIDIVYKFIFLVSLRGKVYYHSRSHTLWRNHILPSCIILWFALIKWIQEHLMMRFIRFPILLCCTAYVAVSRSSSNSFPSWLTWEVAKKEKKKEKDVYVASMTSETWFGFLYLFLWQFTKLWCVKQGSPQMVVEL